MTRKLMFIVGEASADTHAAELIKAFRTKAPYVEIFGAGGPKMKAAGMELLLDLTEHAVVGLVEVLKNYGKFRRIFWRLVREAEQRRPDAVVLVDFPGFNLRFAAQMKKRGIKVIYYISPQLWAWHAGRARQIERDVELMLTIFPFEKDWYAKHAPELRVEFVGHPFAERMRDGGGRMKREERLVLLLPGSREREVTKIWPIMTRIVEQMPSDVTFVAATVNEQMAAMAKHPRVTVEVSKAHELMRRAALAITASGTATMECAFYGCPMIVVYKVNWLTYLVGRAVVTINWLAMPNVIAGRGIVPEFIQHDAKPERIAAVARELLINDSMRETMRGDLAEVVASLGGAGASERAANSILAAISTASPKSSSAGR
ncbi:MAG TPA: lipid-A-disaccharide synthase [Verrucomicrobiae bacterium]|nr:lipid-A-disaccharide synthase [Verrucomicrobiae bacterium]